MAAERRSPVDDAALDLMAGLVLEDGRLWGEVATPWQWADAQANLAQSGPTPYSFQSRPRGGSKTADQGGVLVATLIVQAPPGARLYALAADRDQGSLLIDSIRGFAERGPTVRDLLDISAFRVTVRGTGARLDVLAADSAGAWGLRPFYVVIDEIAQWADTRASRELYEAVRTSVGKVNGRLVVITTAGDPTHFSAEIRAHAIADPLWRVHEVPGPVPWLDRERLDEQRRALPDSTFRRLHLNEWVDAEDRLTTLENLRACAILNGDLAPQPHVEYTVGVDIGITNDRTAVAVCHSEPSITGATPSGQRRVVVDRLRVWHGSPQQPVGLQEVHDHILDASRRYNRARVVIDPHQAIAIAQDLRRQGVFVNEFAFTSTSNARLASMLFTLLRQQAIVLPNDPDLIAELARVRLRETAPNVLRLDHDPGQHDDRAIAIGLAALDLLERHPDDGPRAHWLTTRRNVPRRLGGWP